MFVLCFKFGPPNFLIYCTTLIFKIGRKFEFDECRCGFLMYLILFVINYESLIKKNNKIYESHRTNKFRNFHTTDDYSVVWISKIDISISTLHNCLYVILLHLLQNLLPVTACTCSDSANFTVSTTYFFFRTRIFFLGWGNIYIYAH